MPRLGVGDAGTFNVEEGKRLVLAIEEDAGGDIMHACGSYAEAVLRRFQKPGARLPRDQGSLIISATRGLRKHNRSRGAGRR